MKRTHFNIPTPVLSPTVVSSVKSNPETHTEHKIVLKIPERSIFLLRRSHSYHLGMYTVLLWISSIGIQAGKINNEIMYFNLSYFQYVRKFTCQYKKQKEKEMRNSPAYELNIWNFVHLYVQRKGEEDPYRRADNHGKKQ